MSKDDIVLLIIGFLIGFLTAYSGRNLP